MNNAKDIFGMTDKIIRKCKKKLQLNVMTPGTVENIKVTLKGALLQR